MLFGCVSPVINGLSDKIEESLIRTFDKIKGFACSVIHTYSCLFACVLKIEQYHCKKIWLDTATILTKPGQILVDIKQLLPCSIDISTIV